MGRAGPRTLLAPDLRETLAEFPESHMGAHRVRLVLRSGKILDDVVIAWQSEVVAPEDLLKWLRSEDIVDVLPMDPI